MLPQRPPLYRELKELKERANVAVPSIFKSLVSSIITKQCSCLDPRARTTFLPPTSTTTYSIPAVSQSSCLSPTSLKLTVFLGLPLRPLHRLLNLLLRPSPIRCPAHIRTP